MCNTPKAQNRLYLKDYDLRLYLNTTFQNLALIPGLESHMAKLRVVRTGSGFIPIFPKGAQCASNVAKPRMRTNAPKRGLQIVITSADNKRVLSARNAPYLFPFPLPIPGGTRTYFGNYGWGGLWKPWGKPLEARGETFLVSKGGKENNRVKRKTPTCVLWGPFPNDRRCKQSTRHQLRQLPPQAPSAPAPRR